MARVRTIQGLTPQTSYAASASAVVVARTRELFEHRDNVLDTADVEPLHAMRVATRRLRAALEVFRSCFPQPAFERTLRDVKRLADALGERRDRDVQIEALERYAVRRPAGERAAIAVFVERLRDEQTEANRRLERVLARLERGDLEARLGALAAGAQ